MNGKSAPPFALNDGTADSVHRARQIRNTDFERRRKLYNFFVTDDETTARATNANVNAKRDKVDQWVRGVVNSKALAYINKIQENCLGEMDNVIGARWSCHLEVECWVELSSPSTS
ncbi:hypothetical protein PR001_g8676 [Phytophthora rubi]|uniref:Uncharacterized protein n=1 Tax=Phytophthora rubi TaxID=129364 RepID=A0A6A3MUE1_9STRA|nr:hypothetical protein PR001_g8676 [Phytophthora rubi]